MELIDYTNKWLTGEIQEDLAMVAGGSSLYSVSKSNGTTIFDGYGATDATVSSGSSVSLTSYSGGGPGGGGGQPGGGGGPGRH